jgi:preprotein translocase subunit SecA
MAKLNPLRWGEGRKAKQLSKVVDQVSALAPEMEQLSDAEMRAKTDEFRARLADGETLDDLVVESFALVREAAWRVLHQRPYDVQVFGGLALHDGNIAEMKTGEGKTLTSTMPVYLNALPGLGVHVITVNEYLARRDAEWMGKVHEFLGLTVGVVHSQQPRDAKQRAYQADITYGTTNEFGFDYLRDNMAWDRASQVQRGHHFGLLDEVDSILVDEARTPLIISGQAEQSAQWYQIFARQISPNLKAGEDLGNGKTTGDYVVDEAKRTVAVTEEGVHKVEQLLKIDNLYESVNTPLVHHLQNALKAKELFKRDREYIVMDGEVKIVDEQTGRVLEGRRYSEGLHQSIEAKEGVRIKEENQTLATITLQNYYRHYDKLAGMTGTAKTEEVEFLEIYKLGVVEVPTNRDVIRTDKADLIYKSEQAKFEAVVEDIIQRHENGQPVLVGTTSVEKSELLSGMLVRRGIRHEVLNAKNHAREAHIVAQAGRRAQVTVSTNMAGRGTDIILGGNPEEMAKDDVAKLPEEATHEERVAGLEAAIAKYEAQTQAERDEVLVAGGLYVIGTERHESRRIDNQLRGRSGRQGDPGESRFYLSLQDDLMRLFNASAVDRIMTRLNIPENVPIEAKLVTRAVANAQRQVESRNFDIRKNVLKYDDVLNEQRKVVYGQRQRLVEGDHEYVADLAQKYVEDVIDGAFDVYCQDGVFPEEWELDTLKTHLEQIYPVSIDVTAIDLDDVNRSELIEQVIDDAFEAYERREAEVGGEQIMREVERRVILSVIDRKWREHLYEMDALRDGIGLRAVGQRDPLVEYQREAYASFTSMMAGVKDEAVTYFFHLPVKTAEEQQQEAAAAPRGTTDGRAAAGVSIGGPALGRIEDTAPVGASPATDNGEPAPDGSAPAPDGDGEAAPQIVFDAPKAPTKVSYSSASTGGTASYTVPSGGGAPAVAGSVEHRDDGTTVRRITAGGTYTKSDAEAPDVGRNDPCPCGSGKKFKKCHGA